MNIDDYKKAIEQSGYQSPITVIFDEVKTKLDDDICKAVLEYGIIVDKYELQKALNYDRDQYEQGYADAKKEFERPQGEWKPDRARVYNDDEDTWECSVCGEAFTIIEGTPKDNLYNFCPNCGASMMKGGAE